MNEFRDLKYTVIENQQRMEAALEKMNTMIESQLRMEAVLARVKIRLNEFTR